MNFTIPNLLSLLRMALIPLFIIALYEGEAWRALLIFALAGATDLLDGLIARFFHQQSPLGRYLDPAADKLLLTSAYVMLAIPGLFPGQQIPVWVTVLVITRDVIIVSIALMLYLAHGITEFTPSLISKINTGVQLAAVITVLVSGVAPGFEPLALLAANLAGILTVASGLDYIVRANRMVVVSETRARVRAGDAPATGQDAASKPPEG